MYVAQTDVHQSFQFLPDLRDVFENLQRVFRRHIEQVGNGVAFVVDGKRFGIVPPPAAHFAGDVHIGKKIHLDAPQAVALARLAAPALHVEAEPSGTVAALARFRQHGKQLADGRKHAGVSGWVRPRRAADRRLVNLNHLINVLGALDLCMRAGPLHRAVELLRQRAIEDVVHQSGLARARNSCDHGEHAQWQRHIDVLQVIRLRAKDGNGLAVGRAALLRDGNLQFARQVPPRERSGVRRDIARRADGDQVPAGVAGARAQVHDVVGSADGLLVMLHDEHCVPQVSQSPQRLQQAVVVARVQPDGGLVKHVEHPAQPRPDLRRQANALRLAAGERCRRAVETQIAQADGQQEVEPLGNFAERAPGDLALSRGELLQDLVHRGPRLADGQRRKIGNRPARDLHCQALGPQASLAARAAGHRRHVLRHPLAVAVGV